jgi:rhamnosyltransferase
MMPIPDASLIGDQAGPAAAAPVISIALLIRNGMPELSELLASLRAQAIDEPMEIVAVDSGSTDGSLEALTAAGAQVHPIPPETFSFGPARQLAFSLTRGRVIVTLSQDAMPSSNQWLRQMTQPILAGNADIVQSREEAPPEVKLKLLVYSFTNPYRAWPAPYVDLSCAGMAISRQAWERTGFGNVVMSEDKYLARQAMNQKLRMTFADGVFLLHGHDYGIATLVKRAFNEGVGVQDTGGYYSLLSALRDVLRPGQFKTAVSAVVKYRAMSIAQAAGYPLRPIFLYLGARFGKGYWR